MKSTVRSRMLGYMRARPERSFLATELAQVLGIPLKQAQQATRDAQREGLIKVVGTVHGSRIFALAPHGSGPTYIDESPRARALATAFLDRPIGRLAAQLASEPEHLRQAAYQAHARGEGFP